MFTNELITFRRNARLIVFNYFCCQGAGSVSVEQDCVPLQETYLSIQGPRACNAVLYVGRYVSPYICLKVFTRSSYFSRHRRNCSGFFFLKIFFYWELLLRRGQRTDGGWKIGDGVGDTCSVSSGALVCVFSRRRDSVRHCTGLYNTCAGYYFSRRIRKRCPAAATRLIQLYSYYIFTQCHNIAVIFIASAIAYTRCTDNPKTWWSPPMTCTIISGKSSCLIAFVYLPAVRPQGWNIFFAVSYFLLLVNPAVGFVHYNILWSIKVHNTRVVIGLII